MATQGRPPDPALDLETSNLWRDAVEADLVQARKAQRTLCDWAGLGEQRLSPILGKRGQRVSLDNARRITVALFGAGIVDFDTFVERWDMLPHDEPDELAEFGLVNLVMNDIARELRRAQIRVKPDTLAAIRAGVEHAAKKGRVMLPGFQETVEQLGDDLKPFAQAFSAARQRNARKRSGTRRRQSV